MNTLDFRGILRVLLAHRVEFIVVGGLSATLQGVPLVTFDIDILRRRTPENIARLLDALRKLEAHTYFDPRKLVPNESHLSGPGHLLLATKFGRCDVLGSIDEDVSYEDVLDQTVTIVLDEMQIRVLELSRLIKAKEFAGRPKDLAVLPVLRATLDEIRKRSGSS